MLNACSPEDPKEAEKLLPLVYDELRRLAAAKMASERPGQTLQATALVHEAWIRLMGTDSQNWRDSRQFLAAAAESMRRILIDRARRNARLKHGAGAVHIDLQSIDLADTTCDDSLVAMDEALQELERHHPEHAMLVKLRFFVGLSIEQVSESLGVSAPTAKRQWAFARAWMYRFLARARETP